MKTINTIAGNVYCVTSKNGGTLTDSTGTLNETVEAGKQVHVTAPSDMLLIDDDEAILRPANFKRAPLMLGKQGGGSSAPEVAPGYMLLAFNENKNGRAYVDLGITCSAITGAKYKVWSNSVKYGVLAGNMQTTADTNTFYPLIIYNRVVGINVKGSYYLLKDGTFSSSGVSLNTSNAYSANGETLEGHINWQNDGQIRFRCASFTESRLMPAAILASTRTLYLGIQGAIGYNGYVGRIYNFSLSEGTSIISACVPAVSPSGKACFYDTVRNMELSNIGTEEFVAGFSLSQARHLGRLPAGSVMNVSLPVGWQDDEQVLSARFLAEVKGCVLTVVSEHGEDGEAASTFALRRLWVKRELDENGAYVDADNVRWRIDSCIDIIGANPEDLGYERYRSVEVAAEYWELTPVMEFPEDDLTETE